ncbi:hypothetical protein JCM6882_007147 [Rhodosporidiobolus microsporus]
MVNNIPLGRAVYCAAPDAIEQCIKICAAPDVVSIGVRLGSYLQALAYFLLVLFAPDEGGWLGLSVSFSFLAACYLQMYLNTISLHHVVVVTLLSHLPFISTLAGMNSLTSYEVLGPSGVLFLQTGMLLKSLFTALLWAMCLFAFFVGQLPSWTHLSFRQVNCFDNTSFVLWLIPVKRTERDTGLAIFLIVSYSVFWFVILCAGSYWTLIAPRVLVKRGGHLRDPHRKKIKGFANLKNKVKDDIKTHVKPLSAFISDTSTDDDQSDEARRARKEKRVRHMEEDPSDYRRDDMDGDDLALMTFRSISKGSSSKPSPASVPLPSSRPSSRASTLPPPYPSASPPSPSSSTSSLAQDSGMQLPRSVSPPPATEGMTAIAPWSKGLRGTNAEAAERWTRREVESRHHFIIWPIVAVLLTFTIITIELQIGLNDVFEGEMHLDFPGALTLFLAVPTVWAVIKAMKRIQEGRRPTPEEREDKTFREMASRHSSRRQHRSSASAYSRQSQSTTTSRRQQQHRRSAAAESDSESEASDDSVGYDNYGGSGRDYRAVGKSGGRGGERSGRGSSRSRSRSRGRGRYADGEWA